MAGAVSTRLKWLRRGAFVRQSQSVKLLNSREFTIDIVVFRMLDLRRCLRNPSLSGARSPYSAPIFPIHILFSHSTGSRRIFFETSEYCHFKER